MLQYRVQWVLFISVFCSAALASAAAGARRWHMKSYAAVASFAVESAGFESLSPLRPIVEHEPISNVVSIVIFSYFPLMLYFEELNNWWQAAIDWLKSLP